MYNRHLFQHLLLSLQLLSRVLSKNICHLHSFISPDLKRNKYICQITLSGLLPNIPGWAWGSELAWIHRLIALTLPIWIAGHHEAKALLCVLTFRCKFNYLTAVTLVPPVLSLPCSPTRLSSKDSRPIQKMQHENLRQRKKGSSLPHRVLDFLSSMPVPSQKMLCCS